MRHAFTSFVCALVLAPSLAAAQDPGSDVITYKLTGTRIAFGQDIRVERDEEVSDAVVVIGGSATVDGRVRDGEAIAAVEPADRILIPRHRLHLGGPDA